ncbi:Uncharacterised protein [Rodentibacter pneumotropicus]|uniref:Uncharacterized protein n=1 Tax=Rodentibacter pneumotropicus TaxID=758 RepID=A0A3S4U7S7_9PAST|nr:Uncharacterised protein [Rodentibacter pneumotropicus]
MNQLISQLTKIVGKQYIITDPSKQNLIVADTVSVQEMPLQLLNLQPYLNSGKS